MEYIVEDQPNTNPLYAPYGYVNFGSVEFSQASSSGTYGSGQQTSGYITQYNLTKFVTYDSGIPGSVSYPVDLPYGYFKVSADAGNDAC